MNDLIPITQNQYPQYEGENETFVYMTSIITNDDFDNIKPGSFNVLRAPRGSGKTTWALDEKVIKFATRDKRNMIYLVHTKAVRDAICMHHTDVCRVFTDKDLDGWFKHRQQKMWTSEDDVNYIRVMCYQTFGALLKYDSSWLEDIDAIIWDEFDDIQQYYEKEVKEVHKDFPDYPPEKIAALLQEGRKSSICAFIYNIHRMVLDPKRIRLIAMSATPEIAAKLFGDYVNYIIHGQIAEIYDAKETIYIENVAAALRDDVITPKKNMCPWIYTWRITDVVRLAELCRAKGFNPLTLWSYDNPKWTDYVTDKMREDFLYVQQNKVVPPEYDCVITNQVAGRGLDILDTRFQDWLCDSKNYSDIGQFIRARYSPARKYILTAARGLIDFVRDDTHFSVQFFDWHTKEEMKALLEEHPVYTQDFKTRLENWNAVQKEWSNVYKFESKRRGSRHITYYRIVEERK